MYEVIWKALGKICFFKSNVLNVVFLYMTLCLLLSVIIFVIKMVIALCLLIGQKLLVRLGCMIIERNGDQYIYNKTRLSAIKLIADAKLYYEWIKDKALKMYMYVGLSIEGSTLDKVLHSSLERMVYICRRVFGYFFRFSGSRIMFFLLSLYMLYKDTVTEIIMLVKNAIPWDEIDIETVLDFGELVSLLCIVLYILLDMRHKANGYSELRQERFKDLVKLEEKLLVALETMGFCLYKNIGLLSEAKYRILQRATVELSGRDCCFIDGNFEFKDNKKITDDYLKLFDEYDDLTSVFECISELDEEYKKSSLRGSNIYLTDDDAVLKEVFMFWEPKDEGGDYTKGYRERVSLSRGTMEKWFKNDFVDKAHVGEKVFYLSENETIHCIRKASKELDGMLETAFEFDMYLKKYSEKIRKRLWKIHKFSRFRLF